MTEQEYKNNKKELIALKRQVEFLEQQISTYELNKMPNPNKFVGKYYKIENTSSTILYSLDSYDEGNGCFEATYHEIKDSLKSITMEYVMVLNSVVMSGILKSKWREITFIEYQNKLNDVKERIFTI